MATLLRLFYTSTAPLGKTASKKSKGGIDMELATKRRLYLAAVALILIVAACLYLVTTPKSALPANAVKVLSYQTVASDKPDVWRVSVLITNATSQRVSVSFPTLQTRVETEWANYCEALDPQGN